MARPGNEGKKRLQVIPCDLKVAKAYVQKLHRHHRSPHAHKFSLAVADEDGVFHGVAIVSVPKARYAMDGWTLEVTRVCTNGMPNACSTLYGACARAAKALGYRLIITYTLPVEGGASLRGAGWEQAWETGGGSWARANRPRPLEDHPLDPKTRWQKTLGETPEGQPPQPPDVILDGDGGPDVFDLFGGSDG